MSISLGGRSATVVEKARMGTSKPTNPPSETTTAQATVETDLNRNVTDATIGSAHPVATTTSHSVQNATNVESRKQEEAEKDGLVGAFQIVVDVVEVVEEIQTDVEEIQTDVVEAVTVAVGEIQTDVVEGATEVVVLVATETAVMTDVTLDVVVQAVIATMSAQMSVIEKPEGNGQGMRTTEDLSPFVLDAIKEEIETTEVNGRDSRSPLLGCA